MIEDGSTAASRVTGILASPASFPHGGSKSGVSDSAEAFAELRYDRVCRTPRSEAYLLSERDAPFGRVDLHFGTSVVHGVLIVERELGDEDLHALVQRIDDDLVWTADQPRDDFLFTVYQGSERGVISDGDGAEAGDDEEEAD